MKPLATSISCTTVVCTDWLQKSYPNPSQDPLNPTKITFRNMCIISIGHSWNFSHGLAKFHELIAVPKDHIRFYMTSEYDNYQSSVIQYGLVVGKKSTVLSPDVKFPPPAKAPVVYPSNFSPLTTETGTGVETYATTEIMGHGRVRITQQFAVYTTLRGVSEPQLYGYFEWHPVISIVK